MSYVGSIPGTQNRPLFRDCNVFSVLPITETVTDGVPTFDQGSALSFITSTYLGSATELALTLKRKFAPTKGGTDYAYSERASSWDKGSVSLKGFSSFVGSGFAVIFAGGPFSTLLFTEMSTGDGWVLCCTNEQYTKTMSEDKPNAEDIKMNQVGVPYWLPAGASAAVAIPLDAISGGP
jgi:hypothetical protein